MKIATWNVERLKHSSKLEEIISKIEELEADIFVLTETDSRIKLPNYTNCISTTAPLQSDFIKYKDTENRVTIYTNYEIVQQYPTYDVDTALCVELKTALGNLIIYGTIIGIYGNRNENFNIDLSQQLIDFEKFSKDKNLCVVGDYNISFRDNHYFTNYGRDKLDESFETNGLEIVTRNKEKCIDHISISKKFISNYDIKIKEWNEVKPTLSDHKGILVELTQGGK